MPYSPDPGYNVGGSGGGSGDDLKKIMEELRKEMKETHALVDEIRKANAKKSEYSPLGKDIDKFAGSVRELTSTLDKVIADMGEISMKTMSLITSGGFLKPFASIGSGLEWRISSEQLEAIRSSWYGRAMLSMLKYYKQLYVYFPALGYAGVRIFSRMVRSAEQYGKIQLERQRMMLEQDEERNGLLNDIRAKVGKSISKMSEYYRKSSLKKVVDAIKTSYYKRKFVVKMPKQTNIEDFFAKQFLRDLLILTRETSRIEKRMKSLRSMKKKSEEQVKELQELKRKYHDNLTRMKEINKMMNNVRFSEHFTKFKKDMISAYNKNPVSPKVKKFLNWDYEAGRSKVSSRISPLGYEKKPSIFSRMFGKVSGVFFLVQGLFSIVKVIGFIFGVATSSLMQILKVFQTAFGLFMKPLFDLIMVALMPLLILLTYIAAEYYKAFAQRLLRPFLHWAIGAGKSLIKGVNAIGPVIGGVVKWFNQYIAPPLKTGFNMIAEFAKWITPIIRKILIIVAQLNAVTIIIKVIQYAIKALPGLMKKWGAFYKQYIQPFVNKIKSGWSKFMGLIGAIHNWFSQFINNVITFFNDFPHNIVDAIGKGVSGIIDALKNMIGGFGKGLKNLGGDIVGGLKKTFGFQVGGYVMNTGLYKLHAGEIVVPRWSVGRTIGGEQNNYSINIEVHGEMNNNMIDELIERLRIELGMG